MAHISFHFEVTEGDVAIGIGDIHECGVIANNSMVRFVTVAVKLGNH